MRTSTLARAGAVLTASALSLSLGAGPVSAADAAPKFAAGSVSAAGVPTSAVRFQSGVITSAGATRYFGTATFNVEDSTTATVVVNGKVKGTRPLLFSTTEGDAAIAVDIPRGWGSGKVQIKIGSAFSNVFYARKQIKTTRGNGKFFGIRHAGRKVTFKAYKVKIVNPSNGTYVSLRKIKVQQYKKGKWRTVKTVRLNSAGNGSASIKTGKRYLYRMRSAATSTQVLFQSEKTSKI